MGLRSARTPHEQFSHCSSDAPDSCTRKFGQVVWQVVKFGSDLGPITSEYGRKPGYKTQSRPKRTNHIALVSLPWAQGVVGSNPIAPTNISCPISESWKRQLLKHVISEGVFAEDAEEDTGSWVVRLILQGTIRADGDRKRGVWRRSVRWGSPDEPNRVRVFETCRGCESGSGATVRREHVAQWRLTSLRAPEQASPGRTDF